MTAQPALVGWLISHGWQKLDPAQPDETARWLAPSGGFFCDDFDSALLTQMQAGRNEKDERYEEE